MQDGNKRRIFSNLRFDGFSCKSLPLLHGREKRTSEELVQNLCQGDMFRYNLHH